MNNAKLSFKNEHKQDTWSIDYDGYDPGTNEYSVETLLTVGNGFMGIRGTMPEMKISDDHYPATYLAGLYNEIPSTVGDKEILNEDFVNVPDLQYLTVSVDGEAIDYSSGVVRKLERHLNLKTGLFTAQAQIRTQKGKELLITTKKFASMANRNRYAIFYSVEPLNFDGDVTIISEADGDVFNYNVERYRSLESHHLIIDEMVAEENRARMVTRTSASDISIVQESKLLSDCDLKWENQITDKKIIQKVTVNIKKNLPLVLEKLVYIEKISPNENKDVNKVSDIDELSTFEDMYEESAERWEDLWQEMDIRIEGDPVSEKLLHLHTYHLMVSASPLSAKAMDASVGARGLHGEAYRGHIFWDELFIMPLYIMHFPETARNLLMYRCRRLNAAKEAAKKGGYEGAMYPWQSGLDGREQSQLIHLNPMSGKWDPDNSRLQRHVSLAIAYNIWLYYRNTGDTDFMQDHGLEVLLEITKFWISKAEYDGTTGRYSISGVMGPDEFHEGYPGSDKAGLCDNAYTNIMVSWLMREVSELLSDLPKSAVRKIEMKTGFSTEHNLLMKGIMRKLNVEISGDGIIAQFAGYFDLANIDLKEYSEKYGDIQRMDRILKAEGLSPDDYQVGKQADAMMAFYNLTEKNVEYILADIGHEMPEYYFKKNLDYYMERTTHGSTLSRVVHAWLAYMAGEKDLAWEFYQESLRSDYEDIQGGTVAEGIHAGVMASSVYLTLSIFGGIDIRQDKLVLNPDLPPKWDLLEFSLRLRGIRYKISASHDMVVITADQSTDVVVQNREITLRAGQKEMIILAKAGR